jgi:uncharacterized protein (TIGR04255 family)
MAFPESERVVYEVHTLNQVICQLTFPPILAIGSEAPAAFQDRIRNEYPLYQRQETPQVPKEISDLLANLPVRPPASVVHHFSTADEKRVIALGPESVSVTETDYDEWPALRPQIEIAKRALEEIYQPAFYSRVGLRYQDVLDRDVLGLAHRAWSDLLNPALTGFLGAEEAEIRESVTEQWETTVVRLDPPVAGGAVRVQHGLATAEGESKVVYLLDADYFTNTRQEGAAVLDILDHFRREAGNLFRWAISPLLDDALGRREVEQGSVA